MGAVVPLVIAGGAGWLAWREGLFETLRQRLAAGDSAPENGGVVVNLTLPGQASSQSEPTASSGAGIQTRPQTLGTPAAVRLPQIVDGTKSPDALVNNLLRNVSGARGNLRPKIVPSTTVQTRRDSSGRTAPLSGQVRAEPELFGPEPVITASTTNHVIKRGDTLGAIAARFNTTVARIASINNITNPNLIREGATIRVA